jgi:hypothetical protein
MDTSHKNKMFSRIDVIGQNGNEGTHYGESGPLEFSNEEYNENEFDDYGQRIIHPCVGHSVASDDAIELEDINKILEYVKEDGLITEVVYYALREMQQDPTLSPSEALQFGYSEFIK